MNFLTNYLKNGKGRGFLPVSIFTLLFSGLVGWAVFAFIRMYITAMGQQLPPTSNVIWQFVVPLTVCFFITLWVAFGCQNLLSFLFGKICRFQFNKGTIGRTSMLTMILFWVLAVASMFTSIGFKLWMVLDYFSKSILNLIGPSILMSPWLLIPVVVLVFALIWSVVPALLGMIVLIFVRNKAEAKVEGKATEVITKKGKKAKKA